MGSEEGQLNQNKSRLTHSRKNCAKAGKMQSWVRRRGRRYWGEIPTKRIKNTELFSFAKPSSSIIERLISPPLFLAAPHGMWDLSSPIRDQTHDTCIGRAES